MERTGGFQTGGELDPKKNTQNINNILAHTLLLLASALMVVVMVLHDHRFFKPHSLLHYLPM